MARKRNDLHDIRSRDQFREYEYEEDPRGIEEEEENWILKEWLSHRDEVYPALDEMVAGIMASPLAPRYKDSRAVCSIFPDDDWDSYGNFFSFRFEAGAGYLMDFSLLCDNRRFPLKCKFEQLPWNDGRIEQILSAFDRIKAGMKDGMMMDYYNAYRWSGFAVDLFPNAFFDRDHYYAVDGLLPEVQRPEYDYLRELDYYWQRWGKEPHDFRDVGSFAVSPASYPYAKEFHAIAYHCIRILFPWEPTAEDLAWMEEIKPELEIVRRAVSVENRDIGGGLLTPELLWMQNYHFVIFPDWEQC